MVRCYRRRIPAERLAAYRREALFSLAGFAAMEIVKKTSSELFLTTKLLRSGLVLLLARSFITNGASGLVRDRQLNADNTDSDGRHCLGARGQAGVEPHAARAQQRRGDAHELRGRARGRAALGDVPRLRT